jgi:uncharacterized protein YycO
MKILLFRGRGLISWLIRFQTDSPYSHAAIVIGDTLYEAWQGAGVRKMPYSEHKQRNSTADVDVFELTVPCDVEKVQAYLESRVGKGYDYWGVIRFVTRKHLPENDKDFCSEYVFAGVQDGGVKLLERTEPCEVSPGLLGRSPLLRLKPI